MVFKMLLCGECYNKSLYLKAYKLCIFQDAERRIVCRPLSVNISVTLGTATFGMPL
jgi:hypothetical protein